MGRCIPVMFGLVAWLVGLLVAAPAGPDPSILRHSRYTLKNGLTVILHPVRTVPLVRVHLRVHVGGADEPSDRRGLAHIVEHLTFEGTEHIDAGARARALYFSGAIEVNGSTTLTSTDYHVTVPADYTEMMLWLESDRLGFSAAAVTAANLRAVRGVVANERRERIDTEPYAGLRIALAEALYPPRHGYRGDHIGSLFEIASATPPEALAFLRQWYVPANATLVLAGDLPARTSEWIDKHFGSLPRVEPAPRRAVAPHEPSQEVVLRADEPLGRSVAVLAAWPTPALYTAEDAVADVLAEALLAGGLERLAGASALAPTAAFRQSSLPAQSRFFAQLSAGADADVDALVSVLDDVLGRVRAGALTEAEVRRARERVVARNLAELQTLAGRTQRLHDYAEHRGDPDWLAEDLRRYREVTPEAVASFAATFLRRERRVLLLARPSASVPQGVRP